MPSEYDKITDWLKKHVPSETQGQPDQWSGRGIHFTGAGGKVKPSDVSGAWGAIGIADMEAPKAGIEAVTKLAKGAKEKYDVFKGLPHNAPVRGLMADIQELWNLYGKMRNQIMEGAMPEREKVIAHGALDNFVMSPLQKAQAMALSHASSGAAGTSMVRGAGKASLEDIHAAHEQVKAIIDGAKDMLNSGGKAVKQPKPTGSVAEFLAERRSAMAEQPKQAAQALQALPEAPAAVNQPPVQAQPEPAPQAMQAQTQPSSSAQRVPQPKDPEMYVSDLVNASSKNMRLGPKAVIRLQLRLQDIADNPKLMVVGDEISLLKKILANQGQ